MNHLNILHHYGAVVRAPLLACFFVVVDLGEGRAGDHVARASAELTTKLKGFVSILGILSGFHNFRAVTYQMLKNIF
jgi:hypothetical protein